MRGCWLLGSSSPPSLLRMLDLAIEVVHGENGTAYGLIEGVKDRSQHASRRQERVANLEARCRGYAVPDQRQRIEIDQFLQVKQKNRQMIATKMKQA